MSVAPPLGTRRRRRALAFGVIALAGFLFRLALLPRGPEGWDAVDFVLAVNEYDLDRFQPHFPGYPLLVLAARGFALLGFEAEASMRAVSAFAGALLPVALYGLLVRTLRGMPGNRRAVGLAAAIGAIAATFMPGLLIASTRIESDLAGLVVLLFAWNAAVRRWDLRSGLLGGLALGVRPGSVVLVGALFLWHALRSGKRRWRGTLRWSAGAVAACLAWWLPQIGVVGVTPYFDTACHFVSGHFTDWGGSAFTESDVGARVAAFGWRLAQSIGVSELIRRPATVVYALAYLVPIAYSFRRSGSAWSWVAWILLPQTFVACALQNPDRTRHLEPIALCLAVAVALEWIRGGRVLRRVGAVLAILVVVQGAALLVERSRETPPALQAARAIVAEFTGTNTMVFAGESARLFDLLEHALDVRRARDLLQLERELNSLPGVPERVVVTSEVEVLFPTAYLSFHGEALIHDVARVDVYVYGTVGDGDGAVRLAPLEPDAFPKPR